MKKIWIWILLASLGLGSCVTVSEQTATPAPPLFVTSTLPPTRAPLLPTFTASIPGTPVTPTLDVTSAPKCKASAILVEDVTIPDNTIVAAGTKFTKTWKFQNTGNCAWINYAIYFSSGDRMNAPEFAVVPQTAPKASVEVSVDLTAPSNNGTYTGNFELRDDKGKVIPIGIGKTFWVKIVVGESTPNQSGGSTVNTPAVTKAIDISNCKYSENAGYVQEVANLINQARTDAKLPALTINAQLNAAAQSHSLDMACNNFLGHNGSDGSWIGDRMRAAGYAPSYFVEIIAIGSPQDALNQWHNDQLHWDAVLDPSATEFGVGYAYVAGSNFGGYFTVDFGRP